jgi:hypothetical protein
MLYHYYVYLNNANAGYPAFATVAEATEASRRLGGEVILRLRAEASEEEGG